MSSENIKNESKKKAENVIVPRTPYDVQRIKLQKMMENPDKPIIIPERPKERKLSEAPEFVRNVMGSSAGAGSGEFHVYRHLRRKEYARLKYIEEKAKKERLDQQFQERLLQNKRKSEEKTAKKRAKRLKKKEIMKMKKKLGGKKLNEKKEAEEEDEEDSDDDDDDDEEEDKENPSMEQEEEENGLKKQNDKEFDIEDQESLQESVITDDVGEKEISNQGDALAGSLKTSNKEESEVHMA